MNEATTKAMRITELTIENFMGLSCAELQLDDAGGLVFIGGNNGNGKTSLLRAIEYAIGGGSHRPAQPVKRGAESTTVSLRIGSLLIRKRERVGGKPKLTVEIADGFEAKAPQKMLDELFGAFSFDPSAFSRMKSADQLDLVREMAGLDTTELDEEYESTFATRADLNRESQRLSVIATNLVRHDDAPAELVKLDELLKKREEIVAHNALGERLVAKRDDLDERHGRASKAIAEKREEIASLENTLDHARRDRDLLQAGCDDRRAAWSLACEAVEGFELLGTDDVDEELRNLEATNAKVRANEARAVADLHATQAAKASNFLTDQLDAIKTKRRAMVDSVEMPVEGLSVGLSGLEWNGSPFSQASGAESLRASAGMGMALNPSLRTMLIRDGEKLDDKGLAILAEMAEDGEYQIFLERVGTRDRDAGRSVIEIVDGEIAEEPAGE